MKTPADHAPVPPPQAVHDGAFYSAIFHNSHTAMLIVDPRDGRIVDANPKAEVYYGYPRATLLAMCVTQINTLTPAEVKAEMALARDEQRHQFFFKHRLANGDVRDVEIFSGPIALAGQRYLYSIIHDITEKRAAERALRERERAFRRLTEQVPAIIYRAALDRPSTTIYISPRIAELGYTPEEWLADPDLWLNGLHPHDRDGVLARLDSFQQTGGELSLEYRFRTRSGEWRHYRDQGQIIVDAEGKPLFLQGVMIDVSEQKQLELTLSGLAQRALHLLELPKLADAASETEFMQRGLEMAEALTHSPISFIHFVNADERTLELVTWSRRTLESYCHATFDRHYPIEQAGIWAEALRQRRPVLFNDYAAAEGKRGLPDGHAPLLRLISLPVIENGKVVMLAGIGNKETDYDASDVETLQLLANDIWRIVRKKRYERELADNLTQQRALNRQLEAAHRQLLQSEKMASIGQLAAGVAHELNNPIGFVNSNLGTLDSYLGDLFLILDAYAAAEAAFGVDCPSLERAQGLKRDKDYDFLRSDIRQLLGESREGLARVARIVKDLKDFARAGEVTMQWADLRAGLESTLNIVWNELKYKCEVVKHYAELPPVWCEPSQLNQVFMNLLINAGQAIAEKGVITLATGRQGDAVFVAIGDTGCGIDADNLKRIFDPFFTTKPVGQGTGLGLSLTYGIVQKHGGRIDVDSTPGRGTTFTLWLPIAGAGGALPPPASAVSPAPTFAPGVS